MMQPKKNTIIIPDVHGRTFWKEAIPYVEAGTPCIFLGDYVDPYDDEGISGLDALKNLREILAFAHQYQDRVTMLLGNHDLSYLGDPWGLWTVYADRFCYEWADVISELFNENTDLFSLCAYHEVLHNAIHEQNYTWALELLDFELCRTPQHPYEKADYERHAPSLYSREVIQTYVIINYIAGVLRKETDYAAIDALFAEYGYDLNDYSIQGC